MSNPSELIFTAIALLAAMVALLGISRSKRPSVVARRLMTIYWLLAVLFAFRLVAALYPHAAFNGVILLVAAWLPFAQLRLAEDIVRFHAPSLIKLLTLLGGIAFSILTLVSGLVPSQTILVSLATYQALTFAAVVYVLLAHRHDVSAIDRGVADSFVLALLLGVPLAMTDFHELFPNTPIRGGAFGMMVLVLATSHFASGTGTPKLLLKDIVVILLAGAMMAILLAISPFATSLVQGSQLVGGVIAIASLVILVERFTTGNDVGLGVIRTLARVGDAKNRSSLLAAHPLLSQGRVLDTQTLADYPADTVALLVQHQVVTSQTGEAVTRDAARDLLDRFAASHLMRISVDPPEFLAIASGDLAGPTLDDELVVVARLIEAAT